MKNNKAYLIRLVIGVLGLSQASFAQNISPGVDEIYRPAELAEIHLTLSEEDKAFFYEPENVASEEYKPATFRMVNSRFDTILSTQVGLRLRGNTSRNHDKKGFKIDFREYGGEKFYDYKKFNLKPNVNDPTLIRELLTLQIYNEMGVPAARTHHTKLFINGEYMGVYLNIEQIDDEFLDLRYGHEEGFLYKCSYGANLKNDGQVFNTVVFETEINKDLDNRAELDNLVKVLNNTSDSQFGVQFQKVFNIDTYLRQLAVEALLGHWDAYSYNQNNFYLYYNGETGKFDFIPYDADNTWGIDWVDRDWATRDLNEWPRNNEPRPLSTRILAIDAYKNNYLYYLGELMDKYFNEAYLLPLLEQYKDVLDEAVETDTYYGRAFGYTHNDFLNSFEFKTDVNHVDYGLKQYLATRRSTALNQVDFPDFVLSSGRPLDGPTSIFPNPSLNQYFYLSSSTLVNQQVVVYHISGSQVPVEVLALQHGLYKVIMPQSLVTGLYIIETGKETLKWVYQK